ncbi:hypothetical protein [Paracoccus sulfuroxidans]|uniref:Lipoprotein n=1 Tax=Paracoccus sulfuroxidans TaxID=384678 RepID=A0A562NT93_9RHOB|nr:hypothetical protein [Paracoccus sulfuroxidans]TWI35270.1 hypothetical protein IQ24_01781 [Paracoccus sulfuroxidans]
MKPLAAILFASAFLAACKNDPVDLGLFCGTDAADTVARSSAIAYGPDVPPPQVQRVRPIEESDLVGVMMGDPAPIGLISTDATGALHHVVCADALCAVQDAEKALAACSDQAQCRIVGAVKTATFYPLYLDDDAGGHICAARWANDRS